MRKFLDLDDISAYKIAFNLSNYVWKIVLRWDHFSRVTIGRQFVSSADSISANIAEGFGRYGKKDKIKFYRYSFASNKEAIDWSKKANCRKLLTEEEFTHLSQVLGGMPREINSLIKLTNERLAV